MTDHINLQQRPPQHCKAITRQLKKKKTEKKEKVIYTYLVNIMADLSLMPFKSITSILLDSVRLNTTHA